MGYAPYEPQENTPVDIIYKNTDISKIWGICEILDVSSQTITRWDKEGIFPQWALEALGFSIYYGDPVAELEARIEELEAQLEAKK